MISGKTVYGGFGFAGNGDVITVSAPFGAARGKGIEIMRIDPVTGAVRSRVPIDKKVDVYNDAPFEIDPTNDNVLGAGCWDSQTCTIGRWDSKTGKLVRLSKPASFSWRAVVVDRQGRIYGNTLPGFGCISTVPRCPETAQLLVRFGPDLKVAAKLDVLVTRFDQLDDVGKLEIGNDVPTILTYYGETLAMAVSPNGTIQSLQVPADWGQGRYAGCCVGYWVNKVSRPFLDTFKPDFTHLRRITLPLEFRSESSHAFDWVHGRSRMTLAQLPGVHLRMAADDGGMIYLVESIGPASAKVVWDGGTRLRAIGPKGNVVATWGVGGNRAGLRYPQYVAIDGSGHLWVIDLDPKTRVQSVKVFEPAL